MVRKVYILAPVVIIMAWLSSTLLGILFRIRVSIYENPVIPLSLMGLYLLFGVVLSLKIRRILPFFLSGFLLFGVTFNLFASYEEVLKFGITQNVFTGLVGVLFHSSIFPLVAFSARVELSSLLGLGALGLIVVKGFVIARRFRTSFIQKVVLSCAFGFGVTSFSSFVLAALQLLTLRNVLLVDAAFFSAIFLLPYKDVKLPEMHIELTLKEKRMWIFSGILLLGGLVYAAFFPPLEWDSLAYQAYYSKLMYEHGGMPPLFGPSIGIEMSAAYPPAYQMLGCYLYVYAGESNAQLMSVLSYLLGVLSLVAVFIFAHQVIPSHRMYAVVFTVAVPFFLGFSASPHYMTLLIFFNSLFLVYLSNYVLKGDVPSLYISVIFLGFSCLTSYLALASFLFLFLVYVKKRFPLTVLPGLLAALPPLVRNFYYTGNPLFPLFGLGRQLQNSLWESNTAHFGAQTIYAGLSLTSPFSILDFLMNRISSVRPLIPLLIVVGCIFLVFVRPISDEEKWLSTCFLVSICIFLVKPTFDRYLLVYIPVYSSFFAWLLCKSQNFSVLKRSLQFSLAASLSIVVFGIMITGPLMVASHVKQFPEQPLDQWAYVRQFYPHDAPCWKWLNENTPSEKFVATYDIRLYYIDKKIFPLDGLEALPLYVLSPDEALNFLKRKNVVYLFTSRWTSPADETCPPAYFDNPLTPYLGSEILPLVFVSGQAAVYGVGRQDIDYQKKLETENVLYPVTFEYNFERGAMVYFDIPGDFHKKTVVMQFSRPVKATLHKGHAVSSSLLGELVEGAEGEIFTFTALSGKYTLYIESDESFSVKVLIE